MNTPQHSTSKVTRAVDQLFEAAEILTQRHNREAARELLIDVVLEVFGDEHLSEIVDLLHQAMISQRAADLRACMGFGSRTPPRCPAMRTSRRGADTDDYDDCDYW
jgi:hypothetical protein